MAKPRARMPAHRMAIENKVGESASIEKKCCVLGNVILKVRYWDSFEVSLPQKAKSLHKSAPWKGVKQPSPVMVGHQTQLEKEEKNHLYWLQNVLWTFATFDLDETKPKETTKRTPPTQSQKPKTSIQPVTEAKQLQEWNETSFSLIITIVAVKTLL